MGLLNGSLAGALLAVSILRPDSYAKRRLAPTILLRLLVAALPLFSDTVGHFSKRVDPPAEAHLWVNIGLQLGRASFLLLVSTSWTAGLFIATFLLLPPALHLLVHGLSLALLLPHNANVCRRFLAQHPGNAAVVDYLDAGLRAVVMSAAPAVQPGMDSLSSRSSTQANCEAGAAALQISLGLVLPTMLAWQLQNGMAESIAAQAAARRDAAMAAEVERSQNAKIAALVTRATRGCTTRLLLIGSSMVITYVVALRLLTKA